MPVNWLARLCWKPESVTESPFCVICIWSVLTEPTSPPQTPEAAVILKVNVQGPARFGMVGVGEGVGDGVGEADGVGEGKVGVVVVATVVEVGDCVTEGTGGTVEDGT